MTDILEASTPLDQEAATSFTEPANADTSNNNEPENLENKADEEKKEVPEVKAETTEEKLILDKYKTIEEAHEGLNNRQSMLDKKETEALAKIQKELDEYKTALNNTTGIQVPEQVEMYKEQQAIGQFYQQKELQLLSKYFDMPTDQQELSNAYNYLINNYDSVISTLDPIASRNLTLELVNLQKTKDNDLQIFANKQKEVSNKINQSVKGQISSLVENSFSEQPEIIKNQAKDTVEILSNDLQSFGVKLDPSYFQDVVNHLKERDTKIYNHAFEEGKKQGQLALSKEKTSKKMNGGADGSNPSVKNTGSNVDYSSYNAMSKEERVKYLLS